MHNATSYTLLFSTIEGLYNTIDIIDMGYVSIISMLTAVHCYSLYIHLCSRRDEFRLCQWDFDPHSSPALTCPDCQGC